MFDELQDLTSSPKSTIRSKDPALPGKTNSWCRWRSARRVLWRSVKNSQSKNNHRLISRTRAQDKCTHIQKRMEQVERARHRSIVYDGGRHTWHRNKSKSEGIEGKRRGEVGVETDGLRERRAQLNWPRCDKIKVAKDDLAPSSSLSVCKCIISLPCILLHFLIRSRSPEKGPTDKEPSSRHCRQGRLALVDRITWLFQT